MIFALDFFRIFVVVATVSLICAGVTSCMDRTPREVCVEKRVVMDYVFTPKPVLKCVKHRVLTPEEREAWKASHK